MFMLRPPLAYAFSHGKKAWFLNHVNDEYVKKAQTYHFRSRASFKLLEIQQKFKVLQRCSNILDLGSAPGSWSQAALFINPQLKIAAVDLLPMKELETVDFYQADARSTTLHQLLKTKYVKFDTIISDMAPNFSGTLFQTHQESLQLNKLCLELCVQMGGQGCNLVMKTIEGEKQKQLVTLLQRFYKQVHRFKPKSSRKESAQHYIICKELSLPHHHRPKILQKLKPLDFNSIKSKKQIWELFQCE